MSYYTKDKRPEKKPEINLDDPIVETAGYRSAEVQINEMLMAGQRLVDYRKQRYEFGGDEVVPADYEDPTRRPGFDMADASALKRLTDERFKELQNMGKVPQDDEEAPPSDLPAKPEKKPDEAK